METGKGTVYTGAQIRINFMFDWIQIYISQYTITNLDQFDVSAIHINMGQHKVYMA